MKQGFGGGNNGSIYNYGKSASIGTGKPLLPAN